MAAAVVLLAFPALHPRLRPSAATPIALVAAAKTSRGPCPAIMKADSEDDASFDMASLAERIEKVKAAPDPREVRLLILDSMVPGQRLTLDDAPAPLLDCWNTALARGTPFVMIGSQQVQLNTHGVECTMKVEQTENGSRATIIAGDLVEVCTVGKDEGSRWSGRAATARWSCLDASAPEEQPTDELVENMHELEALLVDWLRLVRTTGRERVPRHLENVLADLGPMPEPELPSKRALWVAGLINPLPALGVALEIRPACLMAPTANARVQVALKGIKDSISRLEE